MHRKEPANGTVVRTASLTFTCGPQGVTQSGRSEGCLCFAGMEAHHIHVPSASSTILNPRKLRTLKDFSNLFGTKT